MKKGIIFDIKEFAINDGPGIRLTIFMKGCPLRCLWCHNPESHSNKPQINLKTNRFIGKEYSVEEVVNKILKFQDVYELSSGGVTFSGGEPLAQADFIIEVASLIPKIHKTLDTSGFCEPKKFKQIIQYFNLIYYDLKLIDDSEHIKYTGVSNKLILENLKTIDTMNIPYHIRIPMIPDITDTKENLSMIEDIILRLKNKPLRVDTLPYNILAGGKYSTFGMEYKLNNTNNNIQNIIEFRKTLKENKLNLLGVKEYA